MKLFSKEIDKKLFKQYPKGSDLSSQVAVAKIFNPYNKGRWYLINSDPEDPNYLWAIVQMGDIVEVGSVSRNELESLRIPPFRLPLERDLGFGGVNAAELFKGLRAGKFYKAGGWTEGSENKEMLLNQAEGFEHHAEEFESAVKKADYVPAWVVAKSERASTDLSDITHYLDGENEQREEEMEGEEEYANGGEVKWQDAHYGDNALVVSENKMGIVIKPYGRKFHLKFADGTEKTYDANELKFFKDMDDFDMGGEVEGVDLFEDYENIPENVQQVLDNFADAFEDGDYKALEKANEALLKIGYTFDYGLDGQAYDLRKVGEKGKSESYARGGEITVKVGDKVKQRKKVGSSIVYGVDGIVYEVNEDRYDGITFKLKDKFGNKSDKLYFLSQFKKSDIKSMASGGMMADGGIIPIEKKGDKKVATIIHDGNVFFVEYYIDNPELKHIKGTDANTYFSVVDNRYSYGKSDKEYIAVTKKLINAIKNNKVAYYEEGGMMEKGGKTASDETVYIEYFNKAKKFAKDRKEFTGQNAYNEAVSWGRKNIGNFNLDMVKFKMAMGGKVKFADKVKSIKASPLERKKVSPKVQKDYGKTYSPKEAEESAKRIVGAMTAKERLMAKRKKGKK